MFCEREGALLSISTGKHASCLVGGIKVGEKVAGCCQPRGLVEKGETVVGGMHLSEQKHARKVGVTKATLMKRELDLRGCRGSG